MISSPLFQFPTAAGGSYQITQNNSQISANGGTVKIESGSDTDLLGVNVKAKNVDMTGIEGDLTLASKQDRVESNSDSYSLTLGMQNVGFSISQSKSNENWTNSQSSIIGTDGVAIKADNLNLIGSVIANRKEDGTDGGNLSIQAEKLNVQDLKDTSESSSFSFGIGTSFADLKDTTGSPGQGWKSGSTDISFANGGHEKEGMSRTTLGQGNINIEDNPEALASVNRDISQAQVVTKDEKTGGFNVDISVSNRLIAATATGDTEDLKAQAKEVKDTLTDLPGNLKIAGTRLETAANDLTNAIEGFFSQGINPVKDYKKSTAINQAFLNFAEQNPDFAKVLANEGAKGTAAYQAAFQACSNFITQELGKQSIVVNINQEQNDYYGKSDQDSNNVSINAANLGKYNPKEYDPEDAAKTAFHEIGHQLEGSDHEVSDRLAGKMLDAWKTENSIRGYTVNQLADLTPRTYADAILLAEGNAIDTQMTEFDGKFVVEGKLPSGYYGPKTMNVSNYDQSVSYLNKSSKFKHIYNTVENSKTEIFVDFINNNDMVFDPNSKKISFDAYSGLKVKSNNGVQSPALGLGHEIKHAYQFINGTYNNVLSTFKGKTENELKEHMRINLEEPATKTESQIARELGEPERMNYHDHIGTVRVKSPISSVKGK